MAGTYSEAPNQMVSAAIGIDYAYRQLGDGAVPLVLLQHFRGNLDNWDPALVDALASNRRVVTFDNVGVGASTGTTPSTVAQMADDAIAFLASMELDEVDILGFSIGSFVAQEMTLKRPICCSDSPRSTSLCFVANGDSDPMILPHYSYLLAGLMPQARLEIYPDSAHGFLFQHHAVFAADVDEFLTEPISS